MNKTDGHARIRTHTTLSVGLFPGCTSLPEIVSGTVEGAAF